MEFADSCLAGESVHFYEEVQQLDKIPSADHVRRIYMARHIIDNYITPDRCNNGGEHISYSHRCRLEILSTLDLAHPNLFKNLINKLIQLMKTSGCKILYTTHSNAGVTTNNRSCPLLSAAVLDPRSLINFTTQSKLRSSPLGQVKKHCISFSGAQWTPPVVDLLAFSTKTYPSEQLPILHLLLPPITHQRQHRHCFGNVGPGEFPLSANPSIVLHFLTVCNLNLQDLTKLEATCSSFRQPSNFPPDNELLLAKLAALDMCRKRAVFKPMSTVQQKVLKQICGGVLEIVVDPVHSLVVKNGGDVFSFGSNSSRQLGHGTMDEEPSPRLNRSLQGIRIIHAAAGAGRTMLISEAGRVYAFGKHSFGETEYGGQGNKLVTSPQLVESLNDIFVVQAAIGNFFTAVL
ncbi:hypothetical protein CASFOL_020970 [Castilleja foliolosa]|uniref:RGS domain-containing protein n=1 Tax=Castilleja foliolosa TaxID=1961234 RepID=A0ABD3D345_9LAMI